jgi:HK97 family phage prohead protease
MARKDWKAGDVLQHDMNFETRVVAEKPDGFISGVASSPKVDCYGHCVVPGAFDAAIRKRGFNGGTGGILLLAHHDEKQPMGVIRRLETVGQNLQIEAELAIKSSRVRDLYEETKVAGGLSFSVGFRLEDFEFTEQKNADGEAEEVFLIKQGDLREVSIVAFPACDDARMHVVKQENSDENVKAWLIEMQQALTSLKDADTVVELERALAAKGFAHSRNEAHKFFALMKSCAHLLQDKPAHAGGDVKVPPHPLLDASMLKPVHDRIAQVLSQL